MNLVNPGVFSQKVATAVWAVGAAACLLGALVIRQLRNAADGQNWPLPAKSLLGRIFPPFADFCPVRIIADRRLSAPSRASPGSVARVVLYRVQRWY
jgi:hypothetical protein